MKVMSLGLQDTPNIFLLEDKFLLCRWDGSTSYTFAENVHPNSSTILHVSFKFSVSVYWS